MKSAWAAALLGAAACAREDCPQPTPQLLSMEAIGEPCGADGNCGSGLSCRAVYEVPGYASPVFTANACTASCDAGCPSGSACATVAGTFQTCLRACQSDADCLTPRSAGTCGDAGICARVQCTDDAQCPSGFGCEIPAVVCCPSGAHCTFSGKVPGYCRRK